MRSEGMININRTIAKIRRYKELKADIIDTDIKLQELEDEMLGITGQGIELKNLYREVKAKQNTISGSVYKVDSNGIPLKDIWKHIVIDRM